MQTPTIEPTAQESPEQRAFAEIAARVTAANLAVEDAREARDRFRFEHPIPTPLIRAQYGELEGAVVQKERALQQLLGPYSEAKARMEGW